MIETVHQISLKIKYKIMHTTRIFPAITCLLALSLAGCIPQNVRDDSTAAASNTPAATATATQPAAPQNSDATSSADTNTASDTPATASDSGQNANSANAPDDAFAIKIDTDRSLWSHLRAGFSLESGLDHKRTQTQLDWYSSHQEYLERVIDRAEPFLHYILTEAQKRKLPTEMVLLPIVESAFQPFAYSHGRAAGLWQFIPSTGKIYGLKQNWWYDGRRDIHASTQAALDYLQNLGEQFNGNWLQALAAYNAGAGNVLRAIRENKRHGRPTDFWHLHLPRETEAYVPKLLALKEIITHPGLYDVSLRCVPFAPGFKVVDVGSQIDLALAAKLAGIDTDTLYMYNPAFNRWATPPDGPYKLILPTEAAITFQDNLKVFPDDKRITWRRHKIRPGETLSVIAVKYRTTTRQLRKVNKLRNNMIRAGHYLIIPVASRGRSAYSLTASMRRQTTQNITRGQRKIAHVVKSGESFWEIARDYHVDMHKLAKWNGMATRDPLRNGQKLVIWKKTSTSAASPHTLNNSASMRTISYTVRNGDSLSRIADRYRVSVNDLERWNNIEGRYLQPGQKLKLLIDVRNQG